MKHDSLTPNPSLAASDSQLWRGSVGWKLALLVAAICAGIYFLNTPWQGHKRPPVATVQSAAPVASMPVVRTQLRAIDNPGPANDPRPVAAGLSSQIAIADENCGTGGPMHTALNPPPAIAGRVVGFMPNAVALALIPRSEQGANGKLDPAYIHNLRALFHPSNAPPIVRMPVVVPAGMNVYVGEDVRMVGGHASPNLACTYVPNLIVAAGPQGG